MQTNEKMVYEAPVVYDLEMTDIPVVAAEDSLNFTMGGDSDLDEEGF